MNLFLGAGLGQMAQGITQGMANAPLLQMQMQNQQDQMDFRRKELEAQQDQHRQASQEGFMRGALNFYKTTGDPKATLNFWNENASKFGLGTLDRLDPIDKENVHVQAIDINGQRHVFRLNVKTGQATPFTDSSGNPLVSEQDPKYEMEKNSASIRNRMMSGEDVSPSVARAAGVSMPSTSNFSWQGEGPLTGSDEILANMVANRELAVADMAKRTGNYNAVIARAKRLNPDLSVWENSQDFAAGRTASFRSKDIAIQSVPHVLDSMVNAGKKLNYDKVQFVGKLQAFKNKQLNDPDFIEYMAIRNDALQTIASAMRGTGATDQAQRLEEEAASPTLPPDGLDAWMKAQMISLEPRLRQFDKIYNRNRNVQQKKPVAWAIDGNGRKVYQYEDGSTGYAE